MKFFIKLTKAKWVFKKPNKKNILIYDRSSEEYSRYLFSRKSCEILDVRYESINIYVFCVTLLTLGIKNFKDNYKKIFIKLVSPKIVYTAIDSNPAFFKLKNIYDKPIYISDQNGMSKVEDSYKQDEFYGELKKYTQKTKKTARVDHIFTFGKNDKEKISTIIKGNTYAFGNTKNNHYTIKSKKKKKITSIIFIISNKKKN